MKVAHRYAVQVSDTTMLTKAAASGPENKIFKMKKPLPVTARASFVIINQLLHFSNNSNFWLFGNFAGGNLRAIHPVIFQLYGKAGSS